MYDQLCENKLKHVRKMGQFRLLLLKMLSAKETSNMETVGGSEFPRVLGKGKTLTLQEKGKQRRDIGVLFGWGFLTQNEKVRTASKPDDKNFF